MAAMRPAGHGVIVRTAGAEEPEATLRRDLDKLQSAWQQIEERSSGVKAPGLVHEEAGLTERAVRDLLDGSFADIWIDDASAYAAVERYLEDCDPKMVERLRLYQDRQPLF